MVVCYLQNATQKSQKVFVHVPSEIAAHDVEEIGMPLTVRFLCFKSKFDSSCGCF
jgi:hypothetical protein